MTTAPKKEMMIEDPRKHSPETVEALRRLLESDAAAQPDPKRPDFFELNNGAMTFYIHISPISGRVLLLAAWPSQPASKGNGSLRLENSPSTCGCV